MGTFSSYFSTNGTYIDGKQCVLVPMINNALISQSEPKLHIILNYCRTGISQPIDFVIIDRFNSTTICSAKLFSLTGKEAFDCWKFYSQIISISVHFYIGLLL